MNETLSKLAYIHKNNLSRQYVIDAKCFNGIDVDSIADFEVRTVDLNEADEFLKSLIVRENDYAKYISSKIEEVPQIPKVLRNVGYLVAYEDSKTDCIYVTRPEIESKMSIILNKKIKRNLLLVGEPGTGKTTLVEQFARKNKSHRVFVIQGAKLVGDSHLRGSFEQRVVDIMEFAHSYHLDIFFDELHSLVDLGKSTGGMSVTDILKPYLSDSKVRFIGATTVKESKILLQDEAFKRRFSVIRIPEFNIEQLMVLKSKFDEEYGINDCLLSDEINTIIHDLSEELPNLYFPDKFIDFLDYYYSFRKVNHSIGESGILKEYIYDNKV